MRKYTLEEIEFITRVMEVRFLDFSIYELMTGINYEKAIFVGPNDSSLEALKKITNQVLINLRRYPNYYKDKMI